MPINYYDVTFPVMEKEREVPQTGMIELIFIPGELGYGVRSCQTVEKTVACHCEKKKIMSPL
jgi:hypothetical protein